MLDQANVKLPKGHRPPVNSISEDGEDDKREQNMTFSESLTTNLSNQQLCERRSPAPGTNQKKTRKLANKPSKLSGKPAGSTRKQQRNNSLPK